MSAVVSVQFGDIQHTIYGRTGVRACVDFAAGTRLVFTNHNSDVTLKLSGTYSHFMTFFVPTDGVERMGYKL